VDPNVTLRWSPGDGADSHHVYFGDNSAAVVAGIQGTDKGPTSATSYDPGALNYSTTYYWRIDAINSSGPTTGDLWSFTVREQAILPPQTAYDPDPPDGAPFIDPYVTLSWKPGLGAILHTVYFGDDYDVVNNTTGGDPREDTTYNPGPLELHIRYYWRVDEFDGAATHKGDVWSFVTKGLLDDFENYSDEVGERIFDFWRDGGGWPSRPAVEAPSIHSNETGAIVGHDIWSPSTSYTTIIETEIVYSGEQSIPLYYNNENPPFYSQADYTFPTHQNWTGEFNFLRLYLHGQPPKFEETPDGGFVLSGAGADIWGTSDEFRFLYMFLIGNGHITARVVDIGQGSNTWAKGGVMIRESLEAGSPHAMMVLTGGAGGGAAFHWRPFVRGDTWSAHNPTPAVSPPYWVRIERKGSALKGYLSPDGVNWMQQGQTESIDMWGAAVFIGLCVTSNVSGELRTYEFDNIDTTGAVLGQWEAEDVGVDQPGNDPAPLYIRLEDTAGNFWEVNHTDPDAVMTKDWDAWEIPLSDFDAAGMDLRAVTKISIGIGKPTGLLPHQGMKLFASSAPVGNGRIWIDDIHLIWLDPQPPEFEVLKGHVRDLLTGEPITDANRARVAYRWRDGTADIDWDYTNSDGFYRMMLPDGEVEIVVTADGFQTSFPELLRVSPYTSIKRDFLLMPDPGPSISCPVYRFVSPNAPYSYYFAADELSEMETLLYDDEPFDLDYWTYNGIAFCAEVEGEPNALPVYRFLARNSQSNIPPYAFAEADLPGAAGDWMRDYDFDESAFAFSAYPPYAGDQETDPEGTYPPGEEPDGTKPVYRFWSESLECHFYTINQTERNEWADKQDWTYLGIAWYAFDCAGL